MKNLLAGFRTSNWRHSRADLAGQLAALNKAQAIIAFDLDGTILHANDNFLQTVGYGLEEVVGQHHRMFVAPDEREGQAYRDFWQRLGGGQHDSGLYRRFAKNGREIWIQGSYSPICDRRGRPRRVIKHAIDVTQQQIRAADMKGRLAAIDRAQAVISFTLDGIILDANDNFLKTLGYTRHEVIGEHHRIFVDAAQRESDGYRQFWARLRSGEYNAGLYRRVRKDGSDVWIQATYNPIFDLAGRPLKIVKYATDVTVQTQAAQVLEQSLTSLSDTVPAIAGEAQNANQLASRASNSATSGGSLVSQLVQTIDDINARAKNMAEVVSVMNSIAFQTNILALNASVEAARAGEQGKGFAVVAQEVRSLALRSAKSAHDIDDLIGNVNDALVECAQRAQQTGIAMHDIVNSTNQVNERINQIAESADAQAGRIEQLNHTITSLQLAGAAA